MMHVVSVPTASTIVVPQPVQRVVMARQNVQHVAVQSSYRVPVVRLSRTPVVLIAGQQGPPGVSGETPVVMRTAAGPLSALRVVCTTDAGTVRAAEPASGPDSASILGVSVTAASAAGQPVSVRTAGLLQDGSWNWSRGPVWLGAGGTLTQTAPTAGRVVRIGFGRGSELFVRIGEPIQLI